MATTKLWKFKSRLDRLIDYAINGEKTENKLYVSGINCMPDTAFRWRYRKWLCPVLQGPRLPSGKHIQQLPSS